MKLVVVGDGGSGKTSLLIRYTTNSFPGEYIPTVFDNYSAGVMSDDKKPINLGLWDTAGREDYDRLRPLSYPQTDVFLFTYCVANRLSLENLLAKWLPETHHHCPLADRFLLGLRSDLRERKSDETQEHFDKRAPHITTVKERKEAARKIGAFGHAECSSLRGEGVKEAFSTLITGWLSELENPTNRKREKQRKRMAKKASGRTSGGGICLLQ
eukprot:CAMPEP_0174237438 /NCGR_PEP_ID=MMETSP0417-20130205/8369_1 /TAXON_ID=242541 /ORGANISM="Mayorella sp, Strain BSH-02190019" /LENGTH=212 /DNA_ID=CAMNT_0015316191 /DNA_START=98 /DNA_END=736 /DNA_ORIENTATION=+